MAKNGNGLVEKVTVHFSKSDLEELVKVCTLRSEDVSGFIRGATLMRLGKLQFLPADRKKALEVAVRA